LLRVQGGGRRHRRPWHSRLRPGAASHGRTAGGRRMSRIPFDPDAIRLLAAVLAETGLSEIEIADKDSRIRVVRAGVATQPPPPAAVVTIAPAIPAPPSHAAEAEA